MWSEPDATWVGSLPYPSLPTDPRDPGGKDGVGGAVIVETCSRGGQQALGLPGSTSVAGLQKAGDKAGPL